MSKIHYSPLFWFYLLMLIVVFVLPFYGAENYSLLTNTTSQLGAQSTPNAWIMNLIFIGLGAFTVLHGIKKFSGFLLLQILLLIFGSALLLTGIFSHAPLDLTLSHSVSEDYWHSVFATATGFSFTFFTISYAFVDRRFTQKVLAIAMGVLATFLSILIFLVPEFAGIWQRGIFIFSFAWLLYLFYYSGEPII